MFFVVVGTHTKCIINEFALDVGIDILIFQCHTVTNGIDLRRSPPELHYIHTSLVCSFSRLPINVFCICILTYQLPIEIQNTIQ